MTDSKKNTIIYITSIIGDNDYGGFIHQAESITRLSKKYDVITLPDTIRVEEKRKKSILLMSKIFHVLRILYEGLKNFRKQNVELIYARHGIATFPGLFLAKLKNIPIIIEINGILYDDVTISNSMSPVKILLKCIDDMAPKYANKLVVVTPGLKKYFETRYKLDTEKIIIIPNGANLDVFKPADKIICREKIYWSSECKYVLFVGNLAPWQGVEYLIRATVNIVREMPDTKIVIVGTGVESNRLKELAKELDATEHINFKGPVDYELVPTYISASDLCVAPFVSLRNEKIGLSPIKIFEYAACGKPIIASKIDNLEFIENQNMGILVPPENHVELGKSIISLLKHPEKMEHMGRNGRNVILSEYSWDRSTEKLVQLIETML